MPFLKLNRQIRNRSNWITRAKAVAAAKKLALKGFFAGNTNHSSSMVARSSPVPASASISVPSFAVLDPAYKDDELDHRLALAVANSHTNSGPSLPSSASVSSAFFEPDHNCNSDDNLYVIWPSLYPTLSPTPARLSIFLTPNSHSQNPPTTHYDFRAENVERRALDEAFDLHAAVNKPTEFKYLCGFLPGAWPAQFAGGNAEQAEEGGNEAETHPPSGKCLLSIQSLVLPRQQCHEEEKAAMANCKKRAREEDDLPKPLHPHGVQSPRPGDRMRGLSSLTMMMTTKKTASRRFQKLRRDQQVVPDDEYPTKSGGDSDPCPAWLTGRLFLFCFVCF